MIIKSQLIEHISSTQPHLSEKDVALSVNQIMDQMSSTLSHSGRIEIRGFGSFNLHYRPPRRAHNPKTGEKLVTNSKFAVHFKPGKDLRERVNASKGLVSIEEMNKNADMSDDELE